MGSVLIRGQSVWPALRVAPQKNPTKFRQCLKEATEYDMPVVVVVGFQERATGIPGILIIFSEPVMLEG